MGAIVHRAMRRKHLKLKVVLHELLRIKIRRIQGIQDDFKRVSGALRSELLRQRF